ncbi:MAG: COQ9 family protein [Alphaproteobacteria bacterium]|nr:COQ9 family protein [Alphaproteobacteria bacterium]
MPTEARRRRLLAAALRHAPFDGWTDRCLKAAAADAGLNEAEARLAFPGGAGEVVEFFAHEADRLMTAALAKEPLAELKIRERIARAVRVRLEQQAPHREAVRRAVALLALPGHGSRSARSLYRTVDAMWYAIGDRSADFSFYTKRLLLGGVYASTLLYWLSDDSPGRAATWAFLDRRIADVLRIQQVRGRFRSRRGGARAERGQRRRAA